MAYITTAAVKEIREELKARFPTNRGWKFSVIRRDGGLAVAIAIMKAPFDMADGKKYVNVNQFHIDSHYKDDEHTRLVLETVKGIITREHFDHSDSQSDYFHVAFYYDMNIGKWDSEFEVSEPVKPWALSDTQKANAILVHSLV